MPSENTEQRKLAAIMFTDMVGYSALSQRDGKLALELLEEHRHLLREIFPRFNGTEIKTIGDAFLVEFKSALEAAQCAIEIQRGLAKRNADAPAERQIEIRIGIHIGDVVHRAGDVYGDGVNIASRIEQLANAGGVCVSMDVERQIRNALEARFEKLAPTELKNISVPMELFRIVLPWERPGTPVAKTQVRPKSKSQKFLPSAIALVSLLIIGIGWWWTAQPRKHSASPAPEKSIAVLPFENLSRDPDNAYFCEGVQDEILTRLSKVADLKVISRTSTQQFKSNPDNLSQIAKQLGVAHILEGSVQKASNQVRVNVQLIHALTDAHLWADTFDRKLTDIFAVESEIAKTIADTLQVKLTGAEQTAIAARPTENSGAHESYLRGRYFLSKRSSDDLRQAIKYFDQAVGQDSNYAPAYAGLADGYAILLDYANVSWTDVLPKARAAAEKALALDNNLAEAHVSLGLIFQQADINPEKAEPEFRRAIALSPNSAAAHYFLALAVLSPLGQHDEAVAEMKRALELDPFSAIMNANLGFIYYHARRYPEAIAQLHKTMELNASFAYPHLILGFALEASGNLTEAITEYEKLYASEKDAELTDRVFGAAILAHAYGQQGNRAKALEFFAQAHDLQARKARLSPFTFALACLSLDKTDEALAALEQSYETRESIAISNIRVDPLLDPLRGNARFEALAEKIIPAHEFKGSTAAK